VLLSTNPARLVLDEGSALRCARCDQELMEALVCSRCGAFYCSQACQKAHWPEHKAACKAARRRGGRGGAESLRVLNGFCGRRSGGVSTQLAPLRA
jgi:hypothetical protein